MGPIQLLYAQQLRKYLDSFPQTPEHPRDLLITDRPAFPDDRRGAFRDPMQAGPMPPADGPIASLYRRRK